MDALGSNRAEYRRLDAMWGQLELTMGIQHGLSELRRSQLLLTLAKREGGVAVTLSVLLVALPVMFDRVPEKYAWWPILVGVLAGIYLVFLAFKLWEAKSELATVTSLLPVERLKRLEDRPEFILTRISGIGSRLSAARDVIKECKSDGTTKKSYLRIEEHWLAELGRLEERSRELFRHRLHTKEEFDLICEWSKSAAEQGE